MTDNEEGVAAALIHARVLFESDRREEALAAFRTLVQRHPENLSAVLDLGALLRQIGRAREAVDLYLRSCQRSDAPAELWVNLGNAQATLGEREAAIASYRRALSLNPSLGVAARYLGRLLLAAGRAAEALPYLEQAAQASPQDPGPLEQLAKALRRLERWAEAVPVLVRVMALKPGDGTAEAELARGLVSSWRLRSGLALAERAIARDPRSAVAWLTKAEALSRRRFPAESRAAYDHVAALDPGSPHVAQCRLINLLYDDQLTAGDRAREHRRAAALWNALTPTSVAFANAPLPGRRLRLGYVTADLRGYHPVAQFIEPVLAHHDPSAVEVFVYSNLAAPDEATARFRSMAHHWRDIARSDDLQAISAIVADKIDVLVDLSGHTGGGRMGIFARRPAPVQATYLAYSHSTGLSAMDYAIVDGEVAPPGREALFSERLLRLAPSLFCFSPPRDAPPASARATDRPIVFGSCNNSAKLTPATIELWTRLLLDLPLTRLRLKAAIFDDDYEIARFTELFAGRGVDANRLDFAGLSPKPQQMLAEFAHVDIALDPIPYNGATTTCLALWMGVPVVSLAGEGYAGRMGASLLGAIGQPDWVAASAEEYIAIAARLAADRPALQRRRFDLREQMRASPLLNGAAFTRRLEKAYRQAWQEWCFSAATIG